MTEARIKTEEFLRKLVLLELEGKDESIEADKIRDEADLYWCKMTEEEKEEIRNLSKELH